MEVGKKVLYLPAEHHAMQRVGNEHAWVMGRKHMNRQGQPDVEELGARRLQEVLGFIHRHPNPQEERKNLVFLRPNKPWEATVTTVHDDGTVDLDVVVGNGFTLHERNIRVDEGKKTPHTCHAAPAPAGNPPTPGKGEGPPTPGSPAGTPAAEGDRPAYTKGRVKPDEPHSLDQDPRRQAKKEDR
jgi:hypothetical protein